MAELAFWSVVQAMVICVVGFRLIVAIRSKSPFAIVGAVLWFLWVSYQLLKSVSSESALAKLLEYSFYIYLSFFFMGHETAAVYNVEVYARHKWLLRLAYGARYAHRMDIAVANAIEDQDGSRASALWRQVPRP